MTTPTQSTETTDSSFCFTASTAARLHALAKKDNRPGLMLRVRVDSGGCSGFQYVYTLEDEAKQDDLRFTAHDATVLVDPISATFLSGAVLDYRVTLGSAQFEINNPNATARCGCGNSFGV